MVVLKDGTKWYGFLGEQSFISSVATERDIYIEQVYDLDNDGNWKYNNGSVWIAHGEIQPLEFQSLEFSPIEPKQNSKRKKQWKKMQQNNRRLMLMKLANREDQILTYLVVVTYRLSLKAQTLIQRLLIELAAVKNNCKQPFSSIRSWRTKTNGAQKLIR